MYPSTPALMRPFDCDLPQHCSLYGLVRGKLTVKYIDLDLDLSLSIFKKLKIVFFDLRLFRGLLRLGLEIFFASYFACQVVSKNFL